MQLLPVLHQKQRQESDCLAACTAMALRYLEIPVDYTRLFSMLKTQAYGTAFSNLRNLAVPLGLFVTVVEGDLDLLRNWLDHSLPPIVAVNTLALPYWHNEDTDHAVVVVGIDEHLVYLHDPAFDLAPQAVSLNKFELAWQEQDYRCGLIGLAELEP